MERSTSESAEGNRKREGEKNHICKDIINNITFIT